MSPYTDPSQRIGRPRRSTTAAVLDRIFAAQLTRVSATLDAHVSRAEQRKRAVYEDEDLTPQQSEWVRIR